MRVGSLVAGTAEPAKTIRLSSNHACLKHPTRHDLSLQKAGHLRRSSPDAAPARQSRSAFTRDPAFDNAGAVGGSLVARRLQQFGGSGFIRLASGFSVVRERN